MPIKQYLHDLQKWEVVILAEHTKDDKRIGFYATWEEADQVLKALETVLMSGGNLL